MADEAGLGNAYGLMYFWPTVMHHTTLAGLNARYEPSDDDTLTFQDGPQHEEAEQALGSAHMLLLFLLQRFNEVFSLGLPNITELNADFARCWNIPVDNTVSQSG